MLEGKKQRHLRCHARMTRKEILTIIFLLIEKEMMLKKTCYNLECVGLPKSKWSRLDSEKYVGQERKLNSGI